MMMDDDGLADLVARAQRGEPTAFDVLVERYGSRLFGYFYRLTGSRHDAEDLLQEVFVRVVRMIGRYEHDGRFEAWLFRIATNLVRDRMRRSKTSREINPVGGQAEEAGEPDFLACQVDATVSSPDYELQRREEVDRMQWAIEQLPGPEREVIVLRHFSQMAFREIADMMDTPLGTALARAHRGLSRLRELMADGSEVNGA